MKIIAILASGTGGHVYPAYTIAQEYIKLGYKILWIGTKNGLENRVISNYRTCKFPRDTREIITEKNIRPI